MKQNVPNYVGSLAMAGFLAVTMLTSTALGQANKTVPEAKPIANTTTNDALAKLDARIAKLAKVAPTPVEGEGWKPLFDGRTLTGWTTTEFAGHGLVHVQDGLIITESGDPLSGFNATNEPPKMDYEVTLEAAKVDGSDFFCGLTFPVGASWCSLIVGGWGGGVVGISSVDSQDASENETSQFKRFDPDHWYRIRVRVTAKKIEAWLESEKVVDLNTNDRRISLRFGDIELSKPLGIATYQTTSAVRDLRIRTIKAEGK